MICTICGNELMVEDVVCSNCETKVGGKATNYNWLLSGYNWDNKSRSSIRAIRNYLSRRNDNSIYNVLLIYDEGNADIEAAKDDLAKSIVEIFEKRVDENYSLESNDWTKKVVRISEKELAESTSIALKNKAVCIIEADGSASMDGWKEIMNLLNQTPGCVKLLCASKSDAYTRLSVDTELFYTEFEKHLFVQDSISENMYVRLMQLIEISEYEYEAEFPEKISEYIEQIYPKADYRGQRFVDDLFDRIKKLHIEKSEDNMLTIKDIPFYHKPLSYEEAIEQLGDYQSVVVQTIKDKTSVASFNKKNNRAIYTNMDLSFVGPKDCGKHAMAKRYARVLFAVDSVRTPTIERFDAKLYIDASANATALLERAFTVRSEGLIYIENVDSLLQDTTVCDTFVQDLNARIQSRGKYCVVVLGFNSEMAYAEFSKNYATSIEKELLESKSHCSFLKPNLVELIVHLLVEKDYFVMSNAKELLENQLANDEDATMEHARDLVNAIELAHGKRVGNVVDNWIFDTDVELKDADKQEEEAEQEEAGEKEEAEQEDNKSEENTAPVEAEAKADASKDNNTKSEVVELPELIPLEKYAGAEIVQSEKYYNVLLLSLSAFGKVRTSTFKDYKGKIIKYIYQLEPVPRYLSQELNIKGEGIDKIIILATDVTTKDTDVFENADKDLDKKIRRFSNGSDEMIFTAEELFKNRVRGYFPENVDEKDIFCTIGIDVNNPGKGVQAAVNELRSIKDLHPNMHLFLDEHGGLRSIQIVVESIVSLLKVEDINIEDIYTVEFDDNEKVGKVKKKLASYGMFDFASGINEFINYGRIDSLERFYSSVDDVNKPIELLKGMRKVADGLALCDTKEFGAGLKTIQENIKSENKDVYFQIFKAAIEEDYGALLNDKANRSILDRIEWCAKKGFLQQALTYIEDRMPEYFMERYIKVQFNGEDTSNQDGERTEASERFNRRKLKGFVNLHWYQSVANIKFYGIIEEIHKLAKEEYEKYLITELGQGSLEDFNDYIKARDGSDNFWIKPFRSNSDIDESKKAYYKEEADELINIYEDIERTVNDKYNLVKNSENVELPQLINNYISYIEVESLYEKCNADGKAGKYLPLQYLLYSYLDRESLGEQIPYYGKDVSNKTWAGIKDGRYNLKKTNRNGTISTLVVTYRLNVKDSNRKLFDNILLLHAALKQDRNNSNHASSKGKRVPSAIVREIILEYVRMSRELEKN